MMKPPMAAANAPSRDGLGTSRIRCRQAIRAIVNSSSVTASPMGCRYLLNRSSQRKRVGVIGCVAVTESCGSDELARINHLVDCARQDGGIQPSYQSLWTK